ncbi:response regulator transcription factor [Cyanobium sp. HWJ4-Hawea]|uniref:LuxR C-terminal-related transcriptional regulator n=1 Tax=Cyanobium sp. HWJ4-Hawea TaxID=2823713 RepID=UPI0020CE51ED|nr:LuxR C-terminal-related transcriptional regulator [Cyanobium sp. HWJ4-Hawea]MCP9808184.1 response regulator transcription factor [Cyanobium sp. HWJ4-Hawea]
MDLTDKISILIERRKVMRKAIITSGLDLSVALAFGKESSLLPLVYCFANPSLIHYIGTDAQSCLDAFTTKAPGFLVCSDELVGGDGFTLIETFKTKHPRTKTFLVCTGLQIDARVHTADWIDGIFYLQEALEGKGVLQEAVIAAVGGHRYRSKQIRSQTETTSALQLKERDYQILDCLADGMSNREISAKLHISEETTKTYTKRLLGNLGARNRLHALILGLRFGITSIAQ